MCQCLEYGLLAMRQDLERKASGTEMRTRRIDISDINKKLHAEVHQISPYFR